jgi:hypothetical protein
MSKEIYFDAVLNQMPRLLGLLDRNIGSLTYGCFDRQYWHYRVVDFPSARLQEAALTLALIYKLDREGNFYFRNPNLLAWINGSLKFWRKIQERDGSFNEWYPHEHSFVATAFSAYAISETLLMMGKGLIGGYDLVLWNLKKTGDWLSRKTEGRVVNQTAGSAIALYNIYLLTKENKYLSAAEDKIEFLSMNQDREGWFKEYGGADIGYLSLTIDYLAKYYDKSKDEKVLRILRRAISFIYSFIYNDYNTFGGNYGSRNTEYLIPSGFEIMTKYSLTESEEIAKIMREAIKNRNTITLASLDDRYLAYLGYTYLQAFKEAKEIVKSCKRESADLYIHYFNLGILIIKNNYFYSVINCKKGGVFKIMFPNNKVLDEWGVILESIRGERFFSGWLNPGTNYSKIQDYVFEIQTNFQKVKQLVPGPLKFIAARIFQLTLGLNEAVALKLKNILRDKLITEKNKTPIILKRVISFKDSRLKIVDKIEGAKGIKTIMLNTKVSYLYVPSSSYYQHSDLQNNSSIYERRDAGSNTIDIAREYDFNGNLITASLS